MAMREDILSTLKYQSWRLVISYQFHLTKSDLRLYTFKSNLMDSHPKNYVLVCCALLVLLHVHYFEFVEGSRLSKFHPTITSSPPTPPHIKLQKVESPSIDGFMYNRAMKYELTAFRPTSPGHSPGIGHDEPPGSL
nr:hypothetical protein CDL12_07956 [Ipomoea trifida]